MYKLFACCDYFDNGKTIRLEDGIKHNSPVKKLQSTPVIVNSKNLYIDLGGGGERGIGVGMGTVPDFERVSANAKPDLSNINLSMPSYNPRVDEIEVMSPPSSLRNFHDKNNYHQSVSRIDPKADFDSSIESILKRDFKEDDIKLAPILLLEDEEGDLLSKKKLEMNAMGLQGGLRKIKDGIALFGTQIKVDDRIVNDCLLHLDIDQFKEIGVYVFIIYYKKETNSYFIRACKDKRPNGKNTMLFVRLTGEHYLKNKDFISLGDQMFLKIITNQSGDVEISKLVVKSEEDKKKFVFNKDKCPIITLGRKKTCDVFLEDGTLVSKVHATIIWDENRNCWKLVDGNGSESNPKPSTNGTWLYPLLSHEIVESTSCRIGSSKIKIVVQNN